jgi:DNA repair photolyase
MTCAVFEDEHYYICHDGRELRHIMKRFSNHPEPWGEFIDVKIWDKIKNPKKYAGKELFIGSVTDPYNPQEELYGRTRVLLTELQGSGAKLSIATKSDLILRDLDLIRTFPDARVSWSVNTLDEAFKDDMDKEVSIERRLAAMKEFHKAGVRTTCFISPIFPGLTDVKAIIERAKNQCNFIWLENLNLRGSYKGRSLWIISKRNTPLFCHCIRKSITEAAAAIGRLSTQS